MRRFVVAVAVAVTGLTFADKPPLTTGYLDVTVRWQRGRVTVERVEAGRFDKPTAIKRWTGRFEARARAGKRILDAVRFDFPLLGDADSGNQGALADKLKENTVATAKVRVPLPDGADAVEVADRHGGPAVPVPLPSRPPDAGTP
jgi:hypothetical protein